LSVEFFIVPFGTFLRNTQGTSYQGIEFLTVPIDTFLWNTQSTSMRALSFLQYPSVRSCGTLSVLHMRALSIPTFGEECIETPSVTFNTLRTQSAAKIIQIPFQLYTSLVPNSDFSHLYFREVPFVNERSPISILLKRFSSVTQKVFLGYSKGFPRLLKRFFQFTQKVFSKS